MGEESWDPAGVALGSTQRPTSAGGHSPGSQGLAGGQVLTQTLHWFS